MEYTNLECNQIDLKQNDMEYTNLKYYPSSTKEWFNSVHSYNKSYIKLLVNTDMIINNLLSNYFNMVKDKAKSTLKRKRARKNRNTGNRIYTSRVEVKHTNTKILIILYTYNKQKYLIEKKMKNIVKFINYKRKKYLLKKRYLVINQLLIRIDYFL